MSDDMTPKACAIRVAGVIAAALLGTLATADNVVKYLFVPGFVWIVMGTTIAGFWAYESYCKEDVQP